TSSELFAVAQNRLRIFEKWFLPIFSVFIAVYQLVIGSHLLRLTVRGDIYGREMRFLLLGAVLASAIAFVSFLFSLYATGLASEEKWRPLKAGGSYFLATAIFAFVCAAGMAFAQFKVQIVLTVLNWAVPIVIILVGCETALNFIFDIYRPRIKGQYSSTAFDSRLLGIIAAPHNILKTVASVIDYQFGFKVSQTWFYQIVEQAVVPLVLVSAVILYLLSCIVIINPDSEAIIERFGSPTDSRGDVRLVGAGISFKLPWPFGIAREFPAKQIQEISIGYMPLEDETKQRQPLLWNREHYKEEYNLLTATESISSQEEGAVPVSIIRGAIPVQYRVVDLYKYLYNHADSEEVLKAVCYREVVKFVASARIEPESETGSTEESLLGAGRAKAALVVTRNIQQQADELGLGVEIVFMGFEGFHPSPQVAEDFQAVTGAVQKKQAAILEAIAMRDMIFTGNVGSVKQAESLHELAGRYLQSQKKDKEYDQLKIQLDNAFTQASGELFALLRGAQSYAYEKSTLAKAAGERFSQQLQAYKASPRIYKHELKMSMLEEALEKIRKYVIVSDGDSEVTIIDLQEKLTPSLYEFEPVEGQ
ncbi:MAG: SPFH domain-containing protein, partial [Phycisphaerae bacterium]|nr:SPFH domain-containing protein [Phycisphaerae bacterium]